MSKLDYRKNIIQNKRKATTWRDFVMEICSWDPLLLHRVNSLVSRYSPESKIHIVSPKTDTTNQMRSDTYDDKQGFYQNLNTLFNSINIPSLAFFGQNENSDYSDSVYGCRNAYLSFAIGESENIFYSKDAFGGANWIINSFFVMNSSNVYQSSSVDKSFNIFYSRYIFNSSDVWFSSNLIGCRECIACNDLQNQSFCIHNKQYKEEEYMKLKKEFLKHKENYNTLWQAVSIDCSNPQSTNVVGNGLFMSKDIQDGYYIFYANNLRNAFITFGENNSHFYDTFDCGGNTEHVYACVGAGVDSSHLYCSSQIGIGSSNLYYCFQCDSCSFCLGCIGLKNKSYCILNKQYTKEERYEKVDEIFGKMENDGTLGEFFPATMNPFYFNDTAAYLIDPTFTKEEIISKGYLWRDESIKVDIPAGALVVQLSDLDRFEGYDINGSRYTDPEILKYIIQDKEGNIYRIVKMEYDFLLKYGLPLPRKHWLDRMRENFKIS